ncbi:MAG: hypothetical protein HGA98_02525 [Deltaproteobacteria bacterium]|nr:hypothetical protein [Deltaproteobacteria bacterium]
MPLSRYRRLRQLWLVAFALGACMINYPFLQIFNRPVFLFGVPLPVLYFTLGWAGSIGVIVLYSRALKRLPPEGGEGDR